MGRVAVMMEAGRADGPMSSHFGKAEWIMIADTEGGVAKFERNDGLNGKSAADLLMRKDCTDVILVDIGDGALRHLKAAKINAWAAPGPVTGDEALRMFTEGQLAPVAAACVTTEHSEGHGCWCTRHGTPAKSSPCCG